MTRYITVNLGEGPIVAEDAGNINLDQENITYDGQPLTEARAEAIGLEAGERLTGRPHLDPSQRPLVHLAFRVPQHVSDQLDEVSARTGARRSDILREALNAYLARTA